MSDPAPSRRLSGEDVLGDPLVRELLGARLVAVLATRDRDGTIHAVPVWFALHDRSIATGSRSRKVRNLELDPRATLVVHDSRPGFEVCGASLVGRVQIVRSDEARPLVDAVHARYVDEANVPSPARAFLESDDVALRFVPDGALTWDERASEANAALRSAGGAYPLVTTSPRPS